VPEFAAAVTCIDGRFHAALVDWVRARAGVPHVDLVTSPGVSAALASSREDATSRSVLDHLAPSLGAHGAQVVVVAAHEGCAADPSDTPAQLAALPLAAATLREGLGPDVEVVAVHLAGDGAITEVALPGADGSHDLAAPGRRNAAA
jgi:hypothetical protein